MTRRFASRPAVSKHAALAVLLALALSSCGISLQSLPKIGGVGGPTYTLRAVFANVVNLPSNAQVRVGAFQVGYVSGISVCNDLKTCGPDKYFKAIVTMKIKKSVALPRTSTAGIAFDTPLGEDFVTLTPPAGAAANTGPFLANDAEIPDTQTATAPSVEDAFGALGMLLNGGGIPQLQIIIRQTNLALNGNQGNIRSLLNTLGATLSSFNQNSSSVDNALQAIANLSTTLRQGSNTISNGIAAIGPAVNVLASENGDFDKLIQNLDQLSTVTNNIISASANGTVQSVQALQPLLSQLVGVQQQLGPALNAVDRLERATPRAIPGDYLQVAINATAQVPPVPSDALPLHKVTVDPPEASQSYNMTPEEVAIATIIEGGLP